MTKLDARRIQRSIKIAAFLLTLATGLGIYLLIFNTSIFSGDKSENLSTDPLGGPIEVQPTTKISPDSNRYLTGEGDYTFIEYIDLACNVCALQHNTIKTLRDQFAGKISFGIKHFPINVHPTSRQRAIAAECAGRQDKFLEFVDAAFALPDLTQDPTDELSTIAISLQLNSDDFNSCLVDSTVVDQITTDASEAMATAAKGVPHSILIDNSNGDLVATFEGRLTDVQFTTQLERLISQ
ncbi:MAG: hypothetical protein COW24_04670 [Candidatus Kerfeldbacteria bacterium CG15_BIG_FIL_POST_REV_8_21_14_020_45_12]|uniref:Thioredoxin-like fold domain-containing protein n=1 Tax=Candidatus Kerfeldbacteria bacterium CG15_BIG_FIL_POST_REV_8_21_14_020_45_12 TaxID=2014247 RepID=A0A2M7H2W7_9BACT|nr:MAG: hypothetical protein COW24_04670 [Candidatus Kerfeldbacteria bacterium CG15_BIG_FIL_POST_REV_8_21_14_020_45_12]PJA93332.1 MAG: hypothetical protein CO132_03170 [Candidatus Kerfeldbacteria bacterium CG_4_9_14_3_um_filter_45_8]